MFFDSPRSRKFLNEKKISHNINKCVDFGLNKHNRIKIGDIFLYSDESIEQIINEAREGILAEIEELKKKNGVNQENEQSSNSITNQNS